ncbi:MAG: tetratricopeptide repeat protein [Verrucomicrobiota bacterium]
MPAKRQRTEEKQPSRRRGGLGALIALTLVLVGGTLAHRARSRSAAIPAHPTFNRDVAPIVYAHCAGCHHEGESAPFQLLTYPEVKQRARQIAEMTAQHLMPPWLPAEGYGTFADERRLTPAQIKTIERWALAGAPEGPPAAPPPPPALSSGWQMGPPDLVVQMQGVYTLPAEGRDIYRTFVVRNPLKADRYVRAIQFRPNSKVVHHAFVQVDETDQSRRLDAQDAEPGFPGMSPPSGSASSGGYFLGWQPGRGATRSPEGLPWTLPAGADLVMQLHMQTSGKTEQVQPSIGFYFAEQPAANTPIKFSLSAYDIDIPAGTSNYLVHAEYQLPVDVQLLAVLPHAHYLGKQLEGFALLPNGQKQWLLKIDHWDFNWQADYRYAQPLTLPKGTRLVMQYTYDNSAANARNPHQPPVRVKYGLQSNDEMAELWFQILVASEPEFETFQTDYQKAIVKDVITFNQWMLQQNPTNSHAHVQLGKALYLQGQEKEALDHFRQAIRVNPFEAEAHYHLGVMLLKRNQPELAKGAFQYAIQINPSHVQALNNLGLVLMRQGKLDEAETQFRAALRAHPADSVVRDNLELLEAARRRTRPANTNQPRGSD